MSLGVNQCDGSSWTYETLQVNKQAGFAAVNHTVVSKCGKNTPSGSFIIAWLVCARPLVLYVPWFPKWKERGGEECTIYQTSVVNLTIS